MLMYLLNNSSIKRTLLLFVFTLLFGFTVSAQKTFDGSVSGNWNTADNWTPSGVPTSTEDVIIPPGQTVTINATAFAKSVSVSGTLILNDGIRFTVGSSLTNGNFTVYSGGEFSVSNGAGTTTTLIVYGNYFNSSRTYFRKATVVITGDLSSPSTSEIQNLGNVIVGGNIIGDFNMTGGSGGTQIFAVNPNATVEITPTSINDNVLPGAPLEPGLIDIVNEVIFGGCNLNASTPQNYTACIGSTATFSVSSTESNPTYKWQIDTTGSGNWTDLTNTAPYSGVTTATLTISPVTAAMYVYKYRAEITTPTCTKSGHFVKLNIKTNTWDGTTWSTGSAPTSTSSENIVFQGDYTIDSNLSACSCTVNSGNVVINSGHTMTITDAVIVASGGSLTFENNSSLVQKNDTAENSGNIIYKRKTTPLKRYDYTYWASPVANATLGQLATNSLFYSFNPGINNWVQESVGTVMVLGKGYIGRAPNALDYTNPQTVETSFTGTPNNGIITTPITKGTGTNGILNLIGNPYPSAIDIDLFLNDQANKDIVGGTIYLWTHNTAISRDNDGDWVYNYSADDYALYNLTGGTKTISAAISGGAVPTGKIAAGQGFFIDANPNPALPNGTYSAVFKNSMRVSGNNTQFFRTSATGNNANTTGVPLEKHRVWLSMSNTQGAYKEALVGYIEGATNGMDRLFDGKTLPSENVISVYSMLANDKLSIQGRSLPFLATDIVPIGYTTTLNGDFSIRLENFDGLFANQNVYLFDNTTGLYHDLKAGAFTFTTTSGTFNNRFELRFTAATLGVKTADNSNMDIRIIAKAQHLSVLSGTSTITGIEVRDLMGKLIYTKKDIHTNEFHSDAIPAGAQMLIVKVILDDEQNVTKKVLMP